MKINKYALLSKRNLQDALLYPTLSILPVTPCNVLFTVNYNCGHFHRRSVGFKHLIKLVELFSLNRDQTHGFCGILDTVRYYGEQCPVNYSLRAKEDAGGHYTRGLTHTQSPPSTDTV